MSICKYLFGLALLWCWGGIDLAAQPQRVYTGVYLMNLYDLNMDEHSFYADFYIWFRWSGDLDPTNFEFVNQIEKWSMTSGISGDEADSLLVDGSNYRIYRVEGRFFHSFLLGRFPLDRHDLDIQIEHPEYTSQELVFVPDTARILVRPSLKLVGWQDLSARMQHVVQDYGTDFGKPGAPAQRYSNLSFIVTLRRPISFFFLKMFLPLAVVMLVSLGALLLHPTYIDTRSALPIGGLLTAVFLQQTYSSALPDTGYMVLMDKIYLLAYVLVSLILLQVIASGNLLRKRSNFGAGRIMRLERRMAFGYFFFFALFVLLLCA